MSEDNNYTYSANINNYVDFAACSRREKEQIVKEHIQRFVRAVYADVLRQNGFVSYGGEDLSWYRVSDNEVMHSVYFYTTRLSIPIFLDMAYGIHPLYQEAPLPVKPYVSMLPGASQEIARESTLGFPNGVYRDDILVNCSYDDFGLNHLLDIFHKFNHASDLKNCYQTHRAFYEENEILHNMSVTLIAEAIYFNDTELYPLCLNRINDLVPRLQNAKLKACRQDAVLFQECKDAILKDRNAYLELLAYRRQVFIHKLSKAGIVF